MSGSSIRVLAVSPRFAPTNGADTHRLRLLLPHAAKANWSVEVLAVDARDVVGPLDPWLEERLPPEVPIHRVRAWSLRGWGLSGLAQRSIWPMWRKGCDLLKTGRFDLVFFTTTEFALHVLGPLWHRRFGVPFCMDFQDPWVSDYYLQRPHVVPPGGRFKHAVADKFHRGIERFVVPPCAGFLSVSSAYLADINHRYGTAVAEQPTLVRPFPAEPAEVYLFSGPRDVSDAHIVGRRWRYIGVVNAAMSRAIAAFFRAWELAVGDHELGAHGISLEAYGTSYAAAGQGTKSIEFLVKGTVLEGKVQESPDRVSYSDMLRMLQASDGLVVFGSDDPAYTASKIYPYLLAKKPLLAIFHQESPAAELMEKLGGGVCVTFNEQTGKDELATNIKRSWFDGEIFDDVQPLNADALIPLTAAAQAVDVGIWMRAIVARNTSKMATPRPEVSTW